MSKWLDWDNKVLAPMLGDGASAAIVTVSDEPVTSLQPLWLMVNTGMDMAST